jgi:hypothetical protein
MAPNSDHFEADEYPARMTPNTSSPSTAITKHTPVLICCATHGELPPAKGIAMYAVTAAPKLM